MPTTKRDQAPEHIRALEFGKNLSSFLRQVRDGHSFLITLDDRVIAELRPASPPARRVPGALRGRISMQPDFDTLPDDVLSLMEGGAG